MCSPPPPAAAIWLTVLLAACTSGRADSDIPNAKPDALPDIVSSTGDLEPEEPVAFDPPAGGFASPFMLTLTVQQADAVVHYTTDGSIPTPRSPQALAPIAIDRTTLVRAITVRDGVSSPVVNRSYFELDESVRDFSSNLPVVVVHLQDGAAPTPQSREHVPAMFGLFPAGEKRSSLAGPAAHTSRLGIKVRGQSTRYNAKPSYTIELRGRDSDDAPAALAGMPADGDWVLYAPFYWDRSMMRNVFAYDLSRKIGRYAPRTEYCEVFLVTEGSPVTMASYAGVYVLTERLTRSPDRIAVDKLKPSDATLPALSGGYIVKADKSDVPGEGFTAADLSLVYDEPSVDDITQKQKAYLGSYLDSCKRAVGAADGRDPITRLHYSELIDVPSFIDHHILNLLLKNPDAFLFSSYLHKPREGKLVAGPIWDFDRSMGTHEPSDNRSEDPQYWGPNQDSQMFRRSFWEQLFDHPEFASQYWARLNALLASTFTSANFRATVDALERQVSEAEARNRARWPESAPRNDSYAEEVEALRDWLDARLKWVTANKGVVPF